MEISNNPYISVIITVYNRKEFLLDAFNSAVNQTLDRSKYEIIVTKNFVDKKIDNYIKKNGGKLVFFKKGGIGAQMADALRYAKGEVICFLDDDDLFDKEKLEVVYNLFKDNNKIVYYRHNFNAIDKNKNIINDFKYGLADKKLYFNWKDKSQVYKFILSNLYFNSSTTSIRKAILLKEIKNLVELNYNPDDFLAYLSLTSKLYLFIDTKVLSEYRIHLKNISRTDKYKRYTYSKRILKKMLKKTKKKLIENVLEAKSIRFELDHKILKNKKITLTLALNYLRYHSIPYLLYCHKVDWFLLLVILSLFNSKMAKNILYKREMLK
jgi:glycosyltransferase involved in cell wall biosynthesis